MSPAIVAAALLPANGDPLAALSVGGSRVAHETDPFDASTTSGADVRASGPAGAGRCAVTVTSP